MEVGVRRPCSCPAPAIRNDRNENECELCGSIRSTSTMRSVHTSTLDEVSRITCIVSPGYICDDR